MFGLIFKFLFLLAPLTLVQCRWSEPPPTDTLVFALASEPKTMDPRYATDANGQRINNLIFTSLVKLGHDLKPASQAASSWKYENGIFSFKVVPGILFHNGKKLTREDILFSFNEYRKPKSPFSAQFKVIKNIEADYNFESGGTVQLHLEHFSASLLNDLPLLKLLPKEEVEKHGDDFYKKLIGSGPYRFSQKDLKNIYLVRNDQYFGKKARSPKLQFKVIKDSNTRFQKMYKGKIDIIQSDVPYSKVKVFSKLENFEIVVKPGLSTTYLLLNLKNPILKQKKVRFAINQAIDRDELIRYTHEGYADNATSILTKASPFHNHDLKLHSMPQEEARKILSQLSNKKIILKTSNTQEAIENGRVITHQLRSMGLNVEQQSYEWGTYYEDVRTGKFELAVMKWVGIFDPDVYRTTLHSEMTPPGRNRGYYSNRQLDKIVTQAIKEADDKRRRDLYMKAQEIVYSELPTIPLWYDKQIAIIHKRVKNYRLPTNGDFSSLTEAYKENAVR